jgi:hypothetical protein
VVESSLAGYTPDNTAVDNITTSKQENKTIYNGQIVVMRDGIMFNMMGQEVK